MKLAAFLILSVALPGFAATNQLDFIWGRGSPRGSIQAQNASEQNGLRGSLWSLDALHPISDDAYLGMGIGHFGSKDNNSAAFIPGSVTTISSSKTSTLLLGRKDLLQGYRFVPYAIAGIGWVKNSLKVSTPEGTLVDETKNAFGYVGGLGLDLLMTQRWVLGIEARYEGSPSEAYDLTDYGQATTGLSEFRTPISLFSAGLKIGYKY